MKKLLILAITIGSLSSAWGAGFQLRYMGAETMGTGMASAGSYGKSASSIYYNPALFMLQNNEHAVGVDLMVIYPSKSEFTSSTGATEDDFTSTKITGGLYYGNQIDEDSAFTLAITTPWANSTDYDSAWEGRYHSLKTDLGAINIQPVLSKRLTEKLILSIGPQIQYLMGDISKATSFGPGGDLVTTFEGESLSAGGVLGLTFTPSEDLTISLNYNSRVKHKLRGDAKFSPEALATGASLQNSDQASAEVVTPDVITLGASMRLSDKIIGHASASYTLWRTFEDLTLVAQNAVGGALPLESKEVQNWDDTYLIALGATVNMSESLVVRGGAFYETGAVSNEYRTPRTQDADRLGLGLGTSFGLSNTLKLDVGLNHVIYLEDITVDRQAQAPTATTPAGVPALKGEYDMSATLLRLGLNYTF